MDYNQGLVRLKVKKRLNDLFIGIIQDIPESEFNPGRNALIVQQQNNIMTYEQFYNVVYRIVLEYIPRDNENPLLRAIKMLPRTMKNIQRINQNKDIIKFQNEILDNYFYDSGNKNIKEKVSELEKEVNKLIEVNNFEILERVLSNFEDRMRSGLLNDLAVLSQLLDKRK